MKRALLGPVGSLCLALALNACGGDAPEVKAPPPPPPVEAPPPVVEKPVEPPKPEPTAEEKKKAEQLEALAKDRAKMEAEHKAEMARWTPELRAEAKALADKAYPTGKAAIQAVMASKTRKPGDAERDKYRHPVETLDFFGFKPTMTVLEYGPGEGWYTELLAPALAKKGKLLVTNGDPNGPPEERSTFYAQRFKLFLDTSPELYGKVETVMIDGKAPKLPHGGHRRHGDPRARAPRHGAEQQAWATGSPRSTRRSSRTACSASSSTAPSPTPCPRRARRRATSRRSGSSRRSRRPGFKLAGKSEINANPKDTKDYADGVWTLPPSFRLGDKDREKYAAIGESDRMTLKFTKVAKAAPKADKPAAAATPAKPATPAAPAKPATSATPAAPAKPATPATPAKKP